MADSRLRPGMQFAATVYDEVKQGGATCGIRWKCMTRPT